MPLLRLVIACLVMAALPLQGIAAASMLFCGSQAAARVAEAASHHGHHTSMDAAVHDHAPAADDAHSADAQEHSCPICAACSQAQAVGEFDSLPLAAPAPSAEPSQPPVRVSSRALTLPDKPPRA